jgi:hypothetical protein
MIMTTYKIIVVLANGTTKYLRGAKDLVAHFVYLLGKVRKSIFRNEDERFEYAGEQFRLCDVTSAKILDEYTHELFLQL